MQTPTTTTSLSLSKAALDWLDSVTPRLAAKARKSAERVIHHEETESYVLLHVAPDVAHMVRMALPAGLRKQTAITIVATT